MTCRIVLTRCKHASEIRQEGFDLTPLSTNYRVPGMVVPAGFCIRPAPVELAEALGYTPRFGPDGFEYVASIQGGGSLGQAGKKEPRFGPDPAPDGSLLWTRRPVSSASLFRTIVSPLDIEWIAPGMTISNAAFVVGVQLQIAAHHGGGTVGEVHRVIARVPYSDGSVEDYGIDWTITEDGVS